jgi:hypothetical protein
MTQTMKTALRVLKLGLVTLAALLAGVLGILWLHDPFPVRVVAQPGPDKERAWWEHPAALTPDEVAAQQWLADTTCRLPPEREGEVWNVGGSQHGVFSIRYQAAFAGYAAAALGMRTPAYIGLTQSVLSNAVARLADRKAWSYIRSYWSREPWFPDPCASGNVMYTGHLMMLMALEEALSGDARFNREGVELVWDNAHRFTYTTKRLAEVTAAQIRAGDGGVPCEPGLVFFACNNHPHDAFRLLEGMGYGDWRIESDKWEKWALGRFHATAGGGAFRVFHHAPTGLSTPVGMPGFDGWCLMWYAPWISDHAGLSNLWRLAKKKIDWTVFGNDPRDTPQSAEKGCCCGGGAACPLSVPPAATASFLAAAARACGDAATAERLEAWLDRHFRKASGGRLWLDTNREWRTGVCANRFLALAQANGSDLRAMVRRPPPRAYFDGALLDSVQPTDTPVYQAYREADGALTVELDGRGGPVTLAFRNVGRAPSIRLPDGVTGTWSERANTLAVASCGRIVLTVRTAQPL